MSATINTTAPLAMRDKELRDRTLVRGWLYAVLVVLFALVMVGGATRMTGSGLSITEWKPIHGVIPPLNQAEWQEEFEKYQQIPQYEQINKDMTLEEFKGIFWWEWAHRLLARGVGFLVAIPLVFFWLSGRLERGLKPRLVGLLALGGLQGAIGWWMVASGLAERVFVSQYRLAIHLTFACIIVMAVTYIARGLATLFGSAGRARRAALRRHHGAAGAGADLSRCPGGGPACRPDLQHLAADGRRRSFPAICSSSSRRGATCSKIPRPCSSSTACSPIRCWWLRSGTPWRRAGRTGNAPMRAAPGCWSASCCVQAAIGVGTLLTQAHMHWALLHQAFALVVLIFATAHWRGTKGAYPLPTEVVVRSIAAGQRKM